MWRDIALANRRALSAALADYRALLVTLARAIDDGDGAALERIFSEASEARRRWQAESAVPRPVDR
jgi:prephenate dehydrogenase